MRGVQAAEGPPLQAVQEVRYEDGPPLPVGEQLRGPQEPHLISPLPLLRPRRLPSRSGDFRGDPVQLHVLAPPLPPHARLKSPLLPKRHVPQHCCGRVGHRDHRRRRLPVPGPAEKRAGQQDGHREVDRGKVRGQDAGAGRGTLRVPV